MVDIYKQWTEHSGWGWEFERREELLGGGWDFTLHVWRWEVVVSMSRR